MLAISVYRPPLQNKYFLHILTKNIDFFADKYHNHLIMGELNVAPSDHLLIEQFKLNLGPIYVLGSCLILILTNMKYSFNHAKSHVNMEKGYGNSKPAMETAKLCQKFFSSHS